MKEVFEKIKERLEEERKKVTKWDSNLHYIYKEGADWMGNKAIEIVNQVAEEYKHGHYGCNFNGQHEKCKDCGLRGECSHYNTEWFAEYSNSEIPNMSGKATGSDVPDINVGKNEVEHMLDTIEMRADETWMDYYRKALKGLRELSGKEYNDGWIPCISGILPVGDGYEYYDPEEDMTYYRQVLVHTNEADIPYCVAYYDTDTWFCAVTGTPLVVDRWKLIEPYQPKGEK